MSYDDLVKRLRNHKGATFGIYQPAEPRIETSTPCYYEQLKQALEQIPAALVEFLDFERLNSHALICEGLFDVIVIPELECFPQRNASKPSDYPALTPLQLSKLQCYLRRGGAVILSAGDLTLGDCGLQESERDRLFRATVGHLGIKPYVADILPLRAGIDLDFLPDLNDIHDLAVPPQGVYLNTSSNALTPEPLAGNVFPERYPVLRNYVVAWGQDACGRRINSAAVFAQNWENGSRVVVVATNRDESLINPRNPRFGSFVRQAAQFCLQRVFVEDVRSDYACYRPGETARIQCRLGSFESSERSVRVTLHATDAETQVLEETRDVCLSPGEVMVLEFELPTEQIVGDLCEIAVRVSDGDRLLSKADNAFVIWQDDVAFAGPTIGIQNTYFNLNGDGAFITGTNYYESHIGELMWLRPDVAKLNADLAQMSRAGMRLIRIHYHHPKWFRDYLDYRHGSLPEYYRDTSSQPLPDEAAMRIIDAHIYLCQKYGIVYGGDWFTLLPAEMGDPTGWMNAPLGPQDLAVLEDCMEMQTRFAVALAERYRDVPGIAWDIGNEISHLEPPRLRNWSGRIKDAFRGVGDRHLLHFGLHNSAAVEDVVDFHAVHMNFRQISQHRIDTHKPQCCQEVWLDRAPTAVGNVQQEADLLQGLLTCIAEGFAGFSPWQWTNQARLWNDHRSTEAEVWDDRLGLAVRDDGTMKPAGRAYQDMAMLLRGVRIEGRQDGKIITRRGRLLVNSPAETPMPRGSMLLVECDDSTIYCGLAAGRVLIDDQPTLEGAGHVFFISNEGMETLPRGLLYVKSTQPGLFRIRNSKDPSSVLLVQSPCQDQPGLEVQWERCEDFVQFNVQPYQTYHWFRVTF